LGKRKDIFEFLLPLFATTESNWQLEMAQNQLIGVCTSYAASGVVKTLGGWHC